MSTAPRFSVVVPSYRRPAQLGHCLRALDALDYPDDAFEVIVIDDGSPTPLSLPPPPPGRTLSRRLYRQPNAGPAAARNRGAALARHPYLAFTDDDCRPEPDWLRELAARLTASPRAMVGGRIVNALDRRLFSRASQLLIDYLYAYYDADHERARFFAGCNIALARTQFDKLGGFDTRYPRAAGEDRDFCQRWIDAGLPMHYHPPARVRHYHALDIAAFYRQHRNYGRGAWQVRAAARRAKHRGRSRLETANFYLGLLGHPFHTARPLAAARLSAALLLSQIATADGYLRERYGTPRPY